METYMFRIIFVFIIAIFSLSQAKTIQSIPLNQIGVEAAKQSGGKGLGITEMWNGYRLESRLQALQAEVTMNGAKIISTSKSEGSGEFTIKTTAIGRKGAIQKTGAVADYVKRSNNVIIVDRKNITEEYSTSGDGIRQDYVINKKPKGEGRLLLDIAFKETVRTINNECVEIMFSSGRKLSYHSLKVADAKGKILKAEFEKTKPDLITIAIDDKEAVYPIRIDPTISDADWISIGGQFFGVNDNVYTIAVDDSGNVYIGGYFTSAGGVTANYIAKWDGSVWSALGSGMNCYVVTLAIDHINNVYAAGFFRTAGGKDAYHIAKWNGSEWSALGDGLNNTIWTIVVDRDNNLYAGGEFTQNNDTSVATNYIAKWDGNKWSALSNGFNGIVRTISIDSSGNLYAGGDFDTVGNIAVNRVAKWNGSVWSSLNGRTNKRINTLAVDTSGNLYAGGEFDTIGGIAASKIAKWDGISWSSLGRGINPI